MGTRFGNVAGIICLVLAVTSAFGFTYCLQEWYLLERFQVVPSQILASAVLPCDADGDTGLPVWVCQIRGAMNPCVPSGADPVGLPEEELFFAIIAVLQVDAPVMPIAQAQALLDSSPYVNGTCANVAVTPDASIFVVELLSLLEPDFTSAELCDRLSSMTRGSFLDLDDFARDKNRFLGLFIGLLFVFLLASFFFFVFVKLSIVKRALCCVNGSKNRSKNVEEKGIVFKSWRRNTTRNVQKSSSPDAQETKDHGDDDDD